MGTTTTIIRDSKHFNHPKIYSNYLEVINCVGEDNWKSEWLEELHKFFSHVKLISGDLVIEKVPKLGDIRFSSMNFIYSSKNEKIRENFGTPILEKIYDAFTFKQLPFTFFSSAMISLIKKFKFLMLKHNLVLEAPTNKPNNFLVKKENWNLIHNFMDGHVRHISSAGNNFMIDFKWPNLITMEDVLIENKILRIVSAKISLKIYSYFYKSKYQEPCEIVKFCEWIMPYPTNASNKRIDWNYIPGLNYLKIIQAVENKFFNFIPSSLEKMIFDYWLNFSDYRTLPL